MELLNKLLDYLLFSLFQPNDTFTIKARKACHLVLLLAVCSCALIAPYYVYAATVDGNLANNWGGLGIVAVVILFGTFGVALPSYVYVRVTKTAPDWLETYTIGFVWLITAFASLLDLNFSLSTQTGTTVIGMIMYVPIANRVLLPCGLIVIFVRAINLGYDGVLMINNHQGPALEKTFVYAVFASVATTAQLLALHFFSKEFQRRYAEMLAAQSVVKLGAESFAQYDTVGARKCLEAYKAQEAHDPSLTTL